MLLLYDIGNRFVCVAARKFIAIGTVNSIRSYALLINFPHSLPNSNTQLLAFSL
jgi:hypothetical protein